MRFDGEKLRDLRRARKWDQHRLAQAAREQSSGITQASVSRYENGQEPSGRNALALASALGVQVAELYMATGASDDDEESDPVAVLLHALRAVVRAEVQAVAR